MYKHSTFTFKFIKFANFMINFCALTLLMFAWSHTYEIIPSSDALVRDFADYPIS